MLSIFRRVFFMMITDAIISVLDGFLVINATF